MDHGLVLDRFIEWCEESFLYKYLGTILDDKLAFEANTERICKKVDQIYFPIYLRKLKSFYVGSSLMKMFYSFFLLSLYSHLQLVVGLAISAWYIIYNRLGCVVKQCRKIIGFHLNDLSQIY